MTIHQLMLLLNRVRIPLVPLDLWIIITFTFFPTVHRDPSHIKIKIAADIAICPEIALVQNPLNPGPPPGNADVHV